MSRFAAIATPLLFLGLLSNSCGHKNPVDPGSPQPLLYSLEMTGYDISDIPGWPACDPIFIPRNGKKVITTVTLVTEGSDRVARSSTKELGNIELRFHQNGTGKTPAEIPVVGEVSGSAVDVDVAKVIHPAVPTSIFVSGRPDGTGKASAEGTTFSPPGLTTGRISGAIRFTDDSGSGFCGAIAWTLQPPLTCADSLRASSFASRRAPFRVPLQKNSRQFRETRRNSRHWTKLAN